MRLFEPAGGEVEREATREEDHNWKLGERIGEASNPGPPQGLRGLWRPKRREPGYGSKAQPAQSCPPHHKGHQGVQPQLKQTGARLRASDRSGHQAQAQRTTGSSNAQVNDGSSLRHLQRGSPLHQSHEEGRLAWRTEFERLYARWECWNGRRCERQDCHFFHGTLEETVQAWERANAPPTYEEATEESIGRRRGKPPKPGPQRVAHPSARPGPQRVARPSAQPGPQRDAPNPALAATRNPRAATSSARPTAATKDDNWTQWAVVGRREGRRKQHAQHHHTEGGRLQQEAASDQRGQQARRGRAAPAQPSRRGGLPPYHTPQEKDTQTPSGNEPARQRLAARQ